MGFYPHTASQYHTRPKFKRGIAMLSVEKFLYPRKQTKGSEFIPCSNDVFHILKYFHSLNPAIPFILPKSLYKLSVAARKMDGGRDRHCDIISNVPFSFYLMPMMSHIKYVSMLHGYFSQ